MDYIISFIDRYPDTKIIFGHVPFGIHEQLNIQDAKYAVVLRSPKRRILSQIRFAFRDQENISSEDISTMIREKKIVDNCQVRMIVGCRNPDENCTDKMLDTAIQNLRSKYAYVGFQEDLSAFIHDLIEGEQWPSVMFVDRNYSHFSSINTSEKENAQLKD